VSLQISNRYQSQDYLVVKGVRYDLELTFIDIGKDSALGKSAMEIQVQVGERLRLVFIKDFQASDG
jgi:hypothetical protein